MTTFYLILFLLSAACFVGAAARAGTTRVNLMALGLLFWVLVPLIGTARNLT